MEFLCIIFIIIFFGGGIIIWNWQILRTMKGG